MSNSSKFLLSVGAAVLLFASVGFGQGISIKRSGVVFYGATANCSQPASIHWNKVRGATLEWKTIHADGVRRGSGRYDLLISDMNGRIKRAAAAAADAADRDCVVRHGDVKNSNGLKVADLTNKVIAEL